MTEPLITTMRKLTTQASHDPETHFLLRLILANNPAPAPWAVWEWARRDVRFHNEWPQVVSSLSRLLQAPVGDCNDLAVATAALLQAARYPVRWALGFDDEGKPRHIWTQAYYDGKWLNVDPSPGADPPGGAPPYQVINATISAYEPVDILN